MEDLNEQVVPDKKLCKYASFKTAYNFEQYLAVLSSKKKISNFAKLRHSALFLGLIEFVPFAILLN